MNVFLKALRSEKKAATAFLEAKGIEARYLDFTDQAVEPVRQPSVPTDVRSEFLANRAMGDWAENLLADALAQQTKFHVVKYGDSDTISAGDPNFKEFYHARLADVRQFGKRPDLLLERKPKMAADVSTKATSDLIDLVKQAAFSIEVRSSKVEALRYMQVRKEDYDNGARGMRMCPSFTVKVEDLIIVHRWLRHHLVPQFYAQVFFDSIYAISFLDILNAMRPDNGITIEKNANNQSKATIHIPITQGHKIGTIDPIPDFDVAKRITRLGRHDSYLKPVGGTLTLDLKALKAAGLA